MSNLFHEKILGLKCNHNFFAGREELELEEILEIEKQMEDLRRAEMLRIEQEAKKQKIREKEALIDELMFAEGDAKEIMNTFAETVLANKQETEPVPLLPKVILA